MAVLPYNNNNINSAILMTIIVLSLASSLFNEYKPQELVFLIGRRGLSYIVQRGYLLWNSSDLSTGMDRSLGLQGEGSGLKVLRLAAIHIPISCRSTERRFCETGAALREHWRQNS